MTEDGRPRGGSLYMLTLTAPGSRRHRNPRTETWCECTPAGGVDLGDWNASASKHWNHLRTVIRRDLARIEYVRVVEVQERGALHLHVVVWSPTPLDVEQLRPLAVRCNFGHEVDLAFIQPGSRKHAYYVAKYVSKSCDSREDVPWTADVVDTDTGEIRRMRTTASYRTWSASAGWGVKMHEIKAAAKRSAIRRQEHLKTALLVAEPSVSAGIEAAPD